MELTFDCLVKKYGTVQALKGISFTLTPGVNGLLGPNGAGKSTMMNILSGNLSQTAGRIAFNGEDIRTMGKEFRKRLGFMPQQQALYPGFTATQFLGYMATLRGMGKTEATDAVHRVLRQVALEDVATRKRIQTLFEENIDIVDYFYQKHNEAYHEISNELMKIKVKEKKKKRN
jgi:ABC-type multidrug transport system ATPase subunit